MTKTLLPALLLAAASIVIPIAGPLPPLQAEDVAAKERTVTIGVPDMH